MRKITAMMFVNPSRSKPCHHDGRIERVIKLNQRLAEKRRTAPEPSRLPVPLIVAYRNILPVNLSGGISAVTTASAFCLGRI